MIVNLETALALLKTVMDEIEPDRENPFGSPCDVCNDEFANIVLNRLDHPYQLIHDYLDSASIQIGTIHDYI